MSKILSYNNKTTGEGWIELHSQYNANEIEMIYDPDGGLTQMPRTAIPSPFAQMDLVKNAFQRLSTHSDLHGEVMDEKLVSDALDVAQLFFNYPEMKQRLHFVEWNKNVCIDQLKQSDTHRLLGETIEMFLVQDAEAFNFDRMDKLYFLVYGNQVVGSTSPVSLFMATPNATKDAFDIHVEQNVKLFEHHRPLHEREPRFVKYVYALFTAYPELKKLCKELNNYIICDFELLPNGLRNEIISILGNPTAYDAVSTEKARNYLQSQLEKIENGVQVLGFPLYNARQEDRQEDITKSDFIIVPTRETASPLPLVLQNRLNATAQDPFRYIVDNWDDSIVIQPDDYALPPEERTLPATNHKYPWLTDDDFLQPSAVKLDYVLNQECFFNGNLSTTASANKRCDFLLPLKPLFFKYFNVEDLWSTVGGQPVFEMHHTDTGGAEQLQVILRIPIQKTGHFITLSRTYLQAQSCDFGYDKKNNCGKFITVPFALSVFPFIKTTALKQYNVQLVDRALGLLEKHELSLSFLKNGFNNALKDTDVAISNRSLKAEKRVGSKYYKLTDSFDYIRVAVQGDSINSTIEGVVCPKWGRHIEGHETFTFAVDFGTTNTHIEYMHGDSLPEPLTISSATNERLLATLYNGESVLYDVIMRQEFLPKSIDETYGFPQRTVISESDHTDVETADNILALGDVNIPFIYEKESVGYGNKIVPNLKWSPEAADNKRVRAYLTELALLMRTKVLLENGDLSKTRLVWFYPLSMKVGKTRKMEEIWKRTFAEVFGTPADDRNIMHMPESVAPYYFYKCSSRFRGTTSSVASIDIGGGTSDVAVFETNGQQPLMLTSFRFAANVLFGDGFSEIPHGDTNPMLTKYISYFQQLFANDDDKYGELNGILDDIAQKNKSEDINAFLFSVEHNKSVGGNDSFSYNMRLNEDSQRKIIFIYFYSTIIYYVAQTMKRRNVSMPQNVMFSGTGSKVLDIVGGQNELDLLTRLIFEKVYGEKYESNSFHVILERRAPKQITCRGALMQVRDTKGCADVDELNQRMYDFEHPLKYNNSLIDKECLTYSDMESQDVRHAIIEAVRQYNQFFITLCADAHVEDVFLVDHKALTQFRDIVNNDLEHYLASGWTFLNKNQDDKSQDDKIEDTVFFYPIIGTIRDNLIENIK